MAFENYKLGIATAQAPVIPFPSDLYESGVRAGKVLALARRVPGVVGYYKVGIGGTLFDTPAEVHDAITRLDIEVKAFQEDLFKSFEGLSCRRPDSALFATQGFSRIPENVDVCRKLVAFQDGAVNNFVLGWERFRQEKVGFFARLDINLAAVNRFRERLVALQEQAASLGVPTTMPKVGPPEPEGSPIGNALKGILGLLKFTVYGLLGLGVVWLVLQFVREIRA